MLTLPGIVGCGDAVWEVDVLVLTGVDDELRAPIFARVHRIESASFDTVNDRNVVEDRYAFFLHTWCIE